MKTTLAGTLGTEVALKRLASHLLKENLFISRLPVFQSKDISLLFYISHFLVSRQPIPKERFTLAHNVRDFSPWSVALLQKLHNGKVWQKETV